MQSVAKHTVGRGIWGAILVVAGVILLLQNLNIVRDAWDVLWAIAFAVGGVACLAAYARNRSR